MSNELQFKFAHGATAYVQVRNATALIWNTGTNAFEAFAAGNVANYAVSATEQASTGYYAASMPAAIPPGVYSILALQQLGVSPAQTDPGVANGDFQWNGTASLPLSDLATSGQVSLIAPPRFAYGVQILNFEFYLVSAADHVTPFTSGVVSGQISKNGGAFAALQSGAFTEIGNGFYSVQALTSGDLACVTAGLLFTANGISGGTSDPRPYTIVTQRTSGN